MTSYVGLTYISGQLVIVITSVALQVPSVRSNKSLSLARGYRLRTQMQESSFPRAKKLRKLKDDLYLSRLLVSIAV